MLAPLGDATPPANARDDAVGVTATPPANAGGRAVAPGFSRGTTIASEKFRARFSGRKNGEARSQKAFFRALKRAHDICRPLFPPAEAGGYVLSPPTATNTLSLDAGRIVIAGLRNGGAQTRVSVPHRRRSCPKPPSSHTHAPHPTPHTPHPTPHTPHPSHTMRAAFTEQEKTWLEISSTTGWKKASQSSS
jgi:hypothetical protein